jgi:hypothetical protein
VDRFVVLAAVGGGLLMTGGVSLLVGARHRLSVAFASALLAVVSVAAWTESPGPVVTTALVLTAVLLAGPVVRSPRLVPMWSLIGRTAARPGAIAIAGLAVLVGSGAGLEWVNDQLTEQDRRALDFAIGGTPARQPVPVEAVTDRGVRLELSLPVSRLSAGEMSEREEGALVRLNAIEAAIRRGPADDRTNCFGWVFARGQYWLGASGADQTLADNGYREVTDPVPGDVAIFRDRAGGQPMHAAIVRYVTAGQPVLVEGKWGWAGVFVHDVNRSPYGSTFTYYRSSRPSHQLALVGVESGPDGPLTGAE